jgi:hypothetical protein
MEKMKVEADRQNASDCRFYPEFIHFLWLNENNFRKFYTEEEIQRSPILSRVWR